MALISAGVNAGTFEPRSSRRRMMTLAPRDSRTGDPRHRPGHDPRLPLTPGMGTRASGFYRHDLDGLRGIAIALVAVFHVWFGRVSGGVDVFLALSGFFFGGRLLRTRADAGRVAVAGTGDHPAGPPAAARAGRGAGRLRRADDPDPAGDALGDVRRPEPGEPRLLPELGTGEHRVGLPARRRGGQPAAAHLVDVGAGPVLHRVPGADLRCSPSVPAACSASTCGSRSSCCSAR